MVVFFCLFLFCFFFFFLDVNLPLLHLPLLQPSSLHLGCTVYTEKKKKQKTKSKTKGRAIFLPGGICRTQWVCVYINIYIIYINIYNTDFKKKSNPHNIHFFLICAKNVFSEKILFSYSDFVLSLICKCASFKHDLPSLVS